jgi:hypothetical protein
VTARIIRRPWILGIVVMASGCDNVSWGGIDVSLKPPDTPSAVTTAQVAEATEETEEPLPPLPERPVLFLATRTGASAVLTPIGELEGGTLSALPREHEVPGFRARFAQERMAPGARFTLFAEGTRVGTFTVGSDPPTESPYCLARAQVGGTVEIVPGVTGAQRFLALAQRIGETFAYGDYQSHTHNYDQRVASLNMGTSLIPQVGATWPSSLLDIRRDIQVFALNGEDPPVVAVTFVYQDRLRQQAAPDNAYSLFVLGQDRGAGYRPIFFRYRQVGEQGKGAPLYLSRLDWNRDGQEEIVLDVYGEETQWFAVVGRRGNRWQTVFEDPCSDASSF